MAGRESVLYKTHSIEGMVALVTGASSGIGESCVWRLAEAGAAVIMVARRKERLDNITKAVTDRFPATKLHSIVLDVRDFDRVEKLLEEIPDEFKAVDILINNAGLARGADPAHLNDVKSVIEVMETNVAAVMAFTKVFAPGMVTRNRGHIVNISSIAGKEAYKGGSVYCASKHAIEAFTTASRHDLVGTPIRVTSIGPGCVRTEFSTVRYASQEKADAVYEDLVPLNGDDCADNVMYALTRPPHVQIADMVIFATCQSGARSIAKGVTF